ncbi:lipid A ABC transporter permease/ATP-binding protein [Anaerocolumna cellulosilytica]|uniref:Lipid A ABC transporter permease/ATP-binding protein n=1 Tax=Anaerocolumna cellulosilytica TaxID=433286 RepID=A0A6S6RB23_9FIRM|nr:ABC transporter ATP-binding protein [Anaerocolumna cellulosilytica]MBB5197793.1 ATP-binding cassette subfamily B protein [Anaerocolumna cellulosilytica]BCJ96442.1 lipid A ABC transporter permease/ATP-binding protein [Anaerocolumna cellulosilytica]
MAKYTETEYEKESNKSVLLRLLAYAKPYWHWMLLAFLLVLCITGLELYRPVLVGDAIDEFIGKGNFNGIKQTAVIYLLVLIGSFVCNFFQTWILQLTGQSIIYNIRQEVFEHVHKLSLRFFDITPVGRIVTRVTNDVEALNEMYANILVKLFKNLIKIVGLAVVMLSIDIRMSLYSFILLPVIIGLTLLFKTISRATYRVVRTKITFINTYLSEHLSGMKLIQIFAREKEKYEEFKEKSRDLYRANFKEMMVFAIFRPSIYILSIISLVIILWVGGNSVLAGTVSIGTLYIFIQYIGSFFEPIQELAEQLGTLQSAMASAEKIFTIMDEKPMIENPRNPVNLPAIKGRIEFEHVWFAYEEENWILKDVSFVIEPGQRAAFVGATGAGKSSILNLIGRYYDIQKGKITVDGVDISELSTEQLRGAIGQVQQDVFIFTGDIKSNIRLKNDEISDEEVHQAAAYVNAADFIEKLSNAYEETVTERGATLSAGQRQLLSFARTLAYDPAILVMDEATANIDTETEQLIQEALEKLMEGRTTIMVAHRLSTIQHADKIIVMHKGKVRESGTHQQLLNVDGIYKKLYELQLQ